MILGNLHSSVSESLNLFVCKIETVIMLPTRASIVAQMVKNLPEMWETGVQSLGQKDPLEKGMATCSSILAWEIPWTEKPGRLWSLGSQRSAQLSN